MKRVLLIAGLGLALSLFHKTVYYGGSGFSLFHVFSSYGLGYPYPFLVWELSWPLPPSESLTLIDILYQHPGASTFNVNQSRTNFIIAMLFWLCIGAVLSYFIKIFTKKMNPKHWKKIVLISLGITLLTLLDYSATSPGLGIPFSFIKRYSTTPDPLALDHYSFNFFLFIVDWVIFVFLVSLLTAIKNVKRKSATFRLGRK